MNYKIVIDKPARKFIKKQSREQQQRILTALHQLPYKGDIFPMRGEKGQYRLRIGTYRAIYSLYHDILTVKVIKIDNRGDIYK